MRNLLLISGLMLAVLFSISIWAWLALPAGEQIPVHWGPNGEPDRYGGKFEGLILLPLIAAAVVGLLAVVPRIDPKGENILRSGKAYRALWIGMLFFFLLLHAALISSIMGVNVPVEVIVPLGVGILFMVIGNFMGKVRRNYMFGIRTPWTLASSRSWDKTHRVGGWLFMLLGLVIIISSLIGS
ncbi:MAG: SdpI family protein, partial [Chloroflexota bacterium]